MERQIRAEDPEIVHFAPPYKVTSKIYLCFPYTKIAIKYFNLYRNQKERLTMQFL